MLHLPVLGSGDGGIYSTAADLSAFWEALFAGRIVSPDRVAEMVRPRSDWPEENRRYGLGFHLAPDRRRGLARGTRRGRVVLQPAPALVLDHLHGHLELVRGCLADRQAARRPARQLRSHSLGTGRLGVCRPAAARAAASLRSAGRPVAMAARPELVSRPVDPVVRTLVPGGGGASTVERDREAEQCSCRPGPTGQVPHHGDSGRDGDEAAKAVDVSLLPRPIGLSRWSGWIDLSLDGSHDMCAGTISGVHAPAGPADDPLRRCPCHAGVAVAGMTDLQQMLATLEPEVRDGEYVYVTDPGGPRGPPTRALIEEAEGRTWWSAERSPTRAGLAYDFVGCWITLTVHSSLDAVGLTAAFSQCPGSSRDRLQRAGRPVPRPHPGASLPAGGRGRSLRALSTQH